MESSPISQEYKKRLSKELEDLFSKNYKNGIEKHEEDLSLRYYKAAMQEAIDDYKIQMENCRSQEEAKNIMTRVLKAFHQRKKKESNTMSKECKERLTKELEELFSKDYKNGIEKHKEDLLLRYYKAAMQEVIDEYKKQMENCRSQQEAKNIMTQVLKAFRHRKKKGSNTMSKECKERLTKELEELFFKNYNNLIEEYYYTAAMQEARDEYKKQMTSCKSQEEAENIKTQVLKAFDQRNKMESNKMSEEYEELLTKELGEFFSKSIWDLIKENMVHPSVDARNGVNAAVVVGIVSGAAAAQIVTSTISVGVPDGGVGL